MLPAYLAPKHLDTQSHVGHLLAVKGVLAREHTQLVLAPEVFQADSTGLLWEESAV